MLDHNEGSFGTLVTGILIGGLVGTAVTLLNAPQSGEEMREQIKEKSTELWVQIGDAQARLAEEIDDIPERVPAV